MADAEHIAKLKEGVEAWGRWRKDHPETTPDLAGADLNNAGLRKANLADAVLANANLGAANLCGANLRGANLSGANLCEAVLIDASLIGANLRRTNLIRANMKGANLSEAAVSDAKLRDAILVGAKLFQSDLHKLDLSGVKIGGADLQESDLRGTNLRGADLSKANLHGADLRGADFTGASLANSNLSAARLKVTTFADNDLASVTGLDSVRHDGHSVIGINTLHKSWGKIPEIFLRGAGVPESFITYMRSFPGQPTEYYSCFISYSTKDQGFAERIHADLQVNGVRCWLASEDLRIGDRFRSRIEKEIGAHDKLLVVLSENSIRSQWVGDEVEAALEQERKKQGTVLFPVRLDEAVTETEESWAKALRRSRQIGDFCKWKDYELYRQAFNRLLSDLKAEKPQSAQLKVS
jgi:uncharacterized protein YjbI with pentapeptide repeats